MIKLDTSKVVQQLKDFHQAAIRKMTHMTYKFSMAIAITASNRTPMGSDAMFPWMYAQRETNPNWESYGLQAKSGFARGSWRLSTDGTLAIQENYGRQSGDASIDSISYSFKEYKLGDTVMISNFGPYIKRLENNHSDQTRGQGIIKPTADMIERVYQFRLDDYYKEAK